MVFALGACDMFREPETGCPKGFTGFLGGVERSVIAQVTTAIQTAVIAEAVVNAVIDPNPAHFAARLAVRADSFCIAIVEYGIDFFPGDKEERHIFE